jgi:hypothetical protein
MSLLSRAPAPRTPKTGRGGNDGSRGVIPDLIRDP